MIRKLLMASMMLGALGSTLAQDIELTIGDLTLMPTQFGSQACVQIPVYIEDTGGTPRQIRGMQFSILVTDGNAVINGGVNQNMAVARGFVDDSGSEPTGIPNPFASIHSLGTAPDCSGSGGYNQATEGQSGDPTVFAPTTEGASVRAGSWTITPQGGGVHQFVLLNENILSTDFFGVTTPGTKQLMAVFQFPVNALMASDNALINLAITGVNNVVTVNTGGGGIADVTLVASADGEGEIQIVEPINCDNANVTVTDNYGGSAAALNYRDPNANAANQGGSITFTITHPTTVEQIHITDGANDVNGSPFAANNSGTTVISLNTSDDGYPSADVNTNNWVITYSFMFQGSTVESTTACSGSVTWAPASCNISHTPAAAVLGSTVDFTATLTNARFANGRFGQVTLVNGGTTVDLNAGNITSGATSNILTYNSSTVAQLQIASLAQADLGNYPVAFVGPGPANANVSCSDGIGLDCPMDADFSYNCGAGGNSNVLVGGSVSVNPDISATSVLTFEVYYPGMSATPFTGLNSAFNLVAAAGFDTFYVRGQGFGDLGGGTFGNCYVPTAAGSGIVENPGAGVTGFWYACTINWAPVVCADGANAVLRTTTPPPPGGYEVGITMVDVELVGQTGGVDDVNKQLNILTATLSNGTALIMQSPGLWTATVPALPNLTVTVTGVAGDQQTCPQSILPADQFNCAVDPNLGGVLVANIGQNISFQATLGCTLLELYESPNCNLTNFSGMTPVATNPVQGTDGDGDGFVTTTFNYQARPDTCYYVVLGGTALLQTANRTVPTLGEWGMIAFVFSLMIAGVVLMRKRRTV